MIEVEADSAQSNVSAPLTLDMPMRLSNGTILKNRLVKSAMSEGLAGPNHDPVDGLEKLYNIWAHGGHALNITGNVMVDRRALGEPGNVVLDDHSDLKKFKQWAAAGTENNAHIWMQLNHPGKQTPGFLSAEPVAPSAVALGGELGSNFNPPRALTEPEIMEIIDSFARSAELAKHCGFTGIQIHGAHGYLISQFLSPHHNQRTDKWGGSLENRMRFLREVYEAVRAKVGTDFPVALKLNSADFSEGGFDEDDSINVAQTLADDGIDLIEVSGGSYEKLAFIDGENHSQGTVRREAFFIEYAEKLRAVTDIPLMLTGGFRSASGMLDALNSDALDLIGMGRGITVEPDLASRLIADNEYSIKLGSHSTGIAKLDTMAMMNVQWYQQQIVRLSRGLSTKPDMSAWAVLFKTILAMGRYAFQRSRA